MQTELTSLLQRGCTHNDRRVRSALTREDVTLNGEPAAIVGAACRFPRVWTIRGNTSAEYAWSTVLRVVRHDDGAFRC
jgi:hypothetical protein